MVFIHSFAASASVGAAPGSLDIGQIERGESVDEDIYVTTSLNEAFIIDPSYTFPRDSILFGGLGSGETPNEKDIEEWVEFEQVTINPNETESIDLEEGGVVNAEGEFELSISVPNDAEPGRYFGSIDLNPSIDRGSGEPGTANLGTTSPWFTFQVPGSSQRDITVQDVRAFRTETNEASVEVLVRNTGSVTTSWNNFDISILDERGSEITKLVVSSGKLSADESRWFNANWEEETVQEGAYEVDGQLEYVTGSSYVSGSFSLGEIVDVVPEDSPQSVSQDSNESLPLWLVSMVLVVLGVLMWSFEIDPVWIFGIVGVLGISGFILISGVSNVLLAGVLIPALLIMYLGV